MFQIARTGFEPVISSLWDLRDDHFSTPHYIYIILHFDEIVKMKILFSSCSVYGQEFFLKFLLISLRSREKFYFTNNLLDWFTVNSKMRFSYWLITIIHFLLYKIVIHLLYKIVIQNFKTQKVVGNRIFSQSLSKYCCVCLKC